MGYEIIRYEDDAALARDAASRWVARVALAAREQRPHRVALPGGRITRRFLSEAFQQASASGIRFDGVDFFWGDERCVLPDDPESNHRLAWETLLGPALVPASRIHRVLGELDPASAAAMAEQDVRRTTGIHGSEWPVLDLVFLGMGEDAHVASLFPGTPPGTAEAPAFYVPVKGPKPPPQRVTMTFGALRAAAEVWVLASGVGKDAALQESLAPGSTTPLGLILARRGPTKVFTDIRAG
jgi:6-phosphogluconolactonase